MYIQCRKRNVNTSIESPYSQVIKPIINANLKHFTSIDLLVKENLHRQRYLLILTIHGRHVGFRCIVYHTP